MLLGVDWFCWVFDMLFVWFLVGLCLVLALVLFSFRSALLDFYWICLVLIDLAWFLVGFSCVVG